MTAQTGDLTRQIASHFSEISTEKLGVAVSGGSDSTALLVLLSDWTELPICAVTVDHGLRAASAMEAETVTRLCADLGVSHDVVQWTGWDGSGNLMAQAREARYRLIADWARARGIDHIALGHTEDDVAETFLMRLRRGAGLDGLSAMAATFERDGVLFHRPLLSTSRMRLREMLAARGVCWVDDPTNEDMQFERARVRHAMRALDMDAQALAQTAQSLRTAREVLGRQAAQVAEQIIGFEAGDVLIDRAGLVAQPNEIARRLMQGALALVSGKGYGPRGPEMTRLMAALDAPRTLQGCRIVPGQQNLRVMREWKAVAGVSVPLGEVWDRRWSVEGPGQGLVVAALGEAGLAHCADRKSTGVPAPSLIASPAVWDGPMLIAAPLAGLENGYRARLVHPPAERLRAILSH